MFVVITLNGHGKVIGPFASQASAEAFSDTNFHNDTWVVAPMIEPHIATAFAEQPATDDQPAPFLVKDVAPEHQFSGWNNVEAKPGQIQKIEIASDFIAANRQGRLNHKLLPESITSILNILPEDVESSGMGDGKVTLQWDFYATDAKGEVHECSIWDYKGARWSFYGPRWVFVQLFGGNVQEGGS